MALPSKKKNSRFVTHQYATKTCSLCFCKCSYIVFDGGYYEFPPEWFATPFCCPNCRNLLDRPCAECGRACLHILYPDSTKPEPIGRCDICSGCFHSRIAGKSRIFVEIPEDQPLDACYVLPKGHENATGEQIDRAGRHFSCIECTKCMGTVFPKTDAESIIANDNYATMMARHDPTEAHYHMFSHIRCPGVGASSTSASE